MKRTILTLAVVLLTAAAADAKCRLFRRGEASNRVVTVQVPSAAPAPKVEAKPSTVAAPTSLPSGCSSGNCRTAPPSRLFRLFR